MIVSYRSWVLASNHACVATSCYSTGKLSFVQRRPPVLPAFAICILDNLALAVFSHLFLQYCPNIIDNVPNIQEDISARLSEIKLPVHAIPEGVPQGKRWHVVRDHVVDNIYKCLIRNTGPQLAALVGHSGCGKTTAAAFIVGEGRDRLRAQRGDSIEQAHVRLDRVRTSFSDGIVWLHAGRGAGGADQCQVS